jgi:hypothetical protein
MKVEYATPTPQDEPLLGVIGQKLQNFINPISLRLANATEGTTKQWIQPDLCRLLDARDTSVSDDGCLFLPLVFFFLFSLRPKAGVLESTSRRLDATSGLLACTIRRKCSRGTNSSHLANGRGNQQPGREPTSDKKVKNR